MNCFLFSPGDHCYFLHLLIASCFILLESFEELSLKNGDLVYLDSRVDLHWLRGHLEKGTSGIFPKDVVEIVVSEWGR